MYKQFYTSMSRIGGVIGCRNRPECGKSRILALFSELVHI